MQRDANNVETVLFSMLFAFVLYGHRSEKCNMTAHSARGESVHILDKLLWRVMETSFLVHNAFLYEHLANGDAILGWARSAHRNGKYTENIIFRVLFSFCQGYMVKKRRHYSAEGTALHKFHGH